MKIKIPAETIQTKCGRNLIISVEMERVLVYLLFMKRGLFGLTRQDVRRLAFQLVILTCRAPSVKSGSTVSSLDTRPLRYGVQQGRRLLEQRDLTKHVCAMS